MYRRYRLNSEATFKTKSKGMGRGEIKTRITVGFFASLAVEVLRKTLSTSNTKTPTEIRGRLVLTWRALVKVFEGFNSSLVNSQTL